MIAILENSLTRHKATTNFVDQYGNVIGFKMAPDGIPVKFEIRGNNGAVIADNTMTHLQSWLCGSHYHFDNNISFVPSEDDGEFEIMNFGLVLDRDAWLYYSAEQCKNKTMLTVRVSGHGGGYYCDNIGLSHDDKRKLFHAYCQPKNIYEPT